MMTQCKLHAGDVIMKQVNKFKNHASVLTRKESATQQDVLGFSKNHSKFKQYINKNFVGNKEKCTVKWYVSLLCGWTIPSKINRLDATEMMLRIPWPEDMCNTVLELIDTKNKLIKIGFLYVWCYNIHLYYFLIEVSLAHMADVHLFAWYKYAYTHRDTHAHVHWRRQTVFNCETFYDMTAEDLFWRYYN